MLKFLTVYVLVYLLSCVAVVAADRYTVMVFSEGMSQSPKWTQWSEVLVFDNLSSNYRRCHGSYVDSDVKARCSPIVFSGGLQPSDDVRFTRGSDMWAQNSSKLFFWQINSKTGELRFCRHYASAAGKEYICVAPSP